jgi:hypothetical protein
MSLHAPMRSLTFSSISNHHSSCSTQTILLVHIGSLLVRISPQPLLLKSRRAVRRQLGGRSYTSGIIFIEIQPLVPSLHSGLHCVKLAPLVGLASLLTAPAPIATRTYHIHRDVCLHVWYRFYPKRTVGSFAAHPSSFRSNWHLCAFRLPLTHILSIRSETFTHTSGRISHCATSVSSQ